MSNRPIRSSFTWSLAGRVLLAIGLGVFLTLTVSFWPFTPDDTFIILRYAQNLAAGAGPTFNPGVVPHTEGYTTFLWMVLMALPHLCGLDAELFAKLAGVLAMLACAVVVAAFARRLSPALDEHRPLAAGVAALCFGSAPATAVHAVSGMETAVYTLLLTTFLYLLTRLSSQPTRWGSVAIASVALLLGLTRPEGNLAVIVGTVVTLGLLPAPSRRRLGVRMAAIYGGGAAAYMLWRVWYYGLLLPLPFYVKVTSATFLAGAPSVWRFCQYIAAHLGVLMLVALAGLPRALIPAGAVAASLIVFFLFPAPFMNYDWRYLFPLVPFLCVLAGVGDASVLAWLERKLAPASVWRRLANVPVVVVPLLVAAAFVSEAPQMIVERAAYAGGLDRAHRALGRRLRPLRASAASPVVAIADSGAVPYYSGWRTIDTFGLNNPEIARSGTHDPEHVFAQPPDLLVLISRRGDVFEPSLPWEGKLYRRAQDGGMVWLRTMPFEEGAYYLWVMGMPSGEIAAALREQ